jgi:hypothetical protein
MKKFAEFAIEEYQKNIELEESKLKGWMKWVCKSLKKDFIKNFRIVPDKIVFNNRLRERPYLGRILVGDYIILFEIYSQPLDIKLIIHYYFNNIQVQNIEDIGRIFIRNSDKNIE